MSRVSGGLYGCPYLSPEYPDFCPEYLGEGTDVRTFARSIWTFVGSICTEVRTSERTRTLRTCTRSIREFLLVPGEITTRYQRYFYGTGYCLHPVPEGTG